MTDDVMEIVEEKPPERGKKYVVPNNYLESEVENITSEQVENIRLCTTHTLPDHLPFCLPPPAGQQTSTGA